MALPVHIGSPARDYLAIEVRPTATRPSAHNDAGFSCVLTTLSTFSRVRDLVCAEDHLAMAWCPQPRTLWVLIRNPTEEPAELQSGVLNPKIPAQLS